MRPTVIPWAKGTRLGVAANSISAAHAGQVAWETPRQDPRASISAEAAALLHASWPRPAQLRRLIFAISCTCHRASQRPHIRSNRAASPRTLFMPGTPPTLSVRPESFDGISMACSVVERPLFPRCSLNKAKQFQWQHPWWYPQVIGNDSQCSRADTKMASARARTPSETTYVIRSYGHERRAARRRCCRNPRAPIPGPRSVL